METKNDLTELHIIHDLLVDSRKGYKVASERAEAENIKLLLTGFTDERMALESAIGDEIRRLEPSPPHRNAGTIKGDLHRAWMDIRDAMSKSNNANVLSECERGEGFLLMRYEEVLKKDDLQPISRTLLSTQRAEVEANVARIKGLRKMYEKIEA